MHHAKSTQQQQLASSNSIVSSLLPLLLLLVLICLSSAAAAANAAAEPTLTTTSSTTTAPCSNIVTFSNGSTIDLSSFTGYFKGMVDRYGHDSDDGYDYIFSPCSLYSACYGDSPCFVASSSWGVTGDLQIYAAGPMTAVGPPGFEQLAITFGPWLNLGFLSTTHMILACGTNRDVALIGKNGGRNQLLVESHEHAEESIYPVLVSSSFCAVAAPPPAPTTAISPPATSSGGGDEITYYGCAANTCVPASECIVVSGRPGACLNKDLANVVVQCDSTPRLCFSGVLAYASGCSPASYSFPATLGCDSCQSVGSPYSYFHFTCNPASGVVQSTRMNDPHCKTSAGEPVVTLQAGTCVSLGQDNYFQLSASPLQWCQVATVIQHNPELPDCTGVVVAQRTFRVDECWLRQKVTGCPVIPLPSSSSTAVATTTTTTSGGPDVTLKMCLSSSSCSSNCYEQSGPSGSCLIFSTAVRAALVTCDMTGLRPCISGTMNYGLHPGSGFSFHTTVACDSCYSPEGTIFFFVSCVSAEGGVQVTFTPYQEPGPDGSCDGATSGAPVLIALNQLVEVGTPDGRAQHWYFKLESTEVEMLQVAEVIQTDPASCAYRKSPTMLITLPVNGDCSNYMAVTGCGGVTSTAAAMTTTKATPSTSSSNPVTYYTCATQTCGECTSQQTHPGACFTGGEGGFVVNCSSTPRKCLSGVASIESDCASEISIPFKVACDSCQSMPSSGFYFSCDESTGVVRATRMIGPVCTTSAGDGAVTLVPGTCVQTGPGVYFKLDAAQPSPLQWCQTATVTEHALSRCEGSVLSQWIFPVDECSLLRKVTGCPPIPLPSSSSSTVATTATTTSTTSGGPDVTLKMCPGSSSCSSNCYEQSGPSGSCLIFSADSCSATVTCDMSMLKTCISGTFHIGPQPDQCALLPSSGLSFELAVACNSYFFLSSKTHYYVDCVTTVEETSVLFTQYGQGTSVTVNLDDCVKVGTAETTGDFYYFKLESVSAEPLRVATVAVSFGTSCSVAEIESTMVVPVNGDCSNYMAVTGCGGAIPSASTSTTTATVSTTAVVATTTTMATTPSGEISVQWCDVSCSHCSTGKAAQSGQCTEMSTAVSANVHCDSAGVQRTCVRGVTGRTCSSANGFAPVPFAFACNSCFGLGGLPFMNIMCDAETGAVSMVRIDVATPVTYDDLRCVGSPQGAVIDLPLGSCVNLPETPSFFEITHGPEPCVIATVKLYQGTSCAAAQFLSVSSIPMNTCSDQVVVSGCPANPKNVSTTTAVVATTPSPSSGNNITYHACTTDTCDDEQCELFSTQPGVCFSALPKHFVVDCDSTTPRMCFSCAIAYASSNCAPAVSISAAVACDSCQDLSGGFFHFTCDHSSGVVSSLHMMDSLCTTASGDAAVKLVAGECVQLSNVVYIMLASSQPSLHACQTTTVTEYSSLGCEGPPVAQWTFPVDECSLHQKVTGCPAIPLPSSSSSTTTVATTTTTIAPPLLTYSVCPGEHCSNDCTDYSFPEGHCFFDSMNMGTTVNCSSTPRMCFSGLSGDNSRCSSDSFPVKIECNSCQSLPESGFYFSCDQSTGVVQATRMIGTVCTTSAGDGAVTLTPGECVQIGPGAYFKLDAAQPSPLQWCQTATVTRHSAEECATSPVFSEWTAPVGVCSLLRKVTGCPAIPLPSSSPVVTSTSVATSTTTTTASPSSTTTTNPSSTSAGGGVTLYSCTNQTCGECTSQQTHPGTCFTANEEGFIVNCSSTPRKCFSGAIAFGGACPSDVSYPATLACNSCQTLAGGNYFHMTCDHVTGVVQSTRMNDPLCSASAGYPVVNLVAGECVPISAGLYFMLDAEPPQWYQTATVAEYFSLSCANGAVSQATFAVDTCSLLKKVTGCPVIPLPTTSSTTTATTTTATTTSTTTAPPTTTSTTSSTTTTAAPTSSTTTSTTTTPTPTSTTTPTTNSTTATNTAAPSSSTTTATTTSTTTTQPSSSTASNITTAATTTTTSPPASTTTATSAAQSTTTGATTTTTATNASSSTSTTTTSSEPTTTTSTASPSSASTTKASDNNTTTPNTTTTTTTSSSSSEATTTTSPETTSTTAPTSNPPSPSSSASPPITPTHGAASMNNNTNNNNATQTDDSGGHIGSGTLAGIIIGTLLGFIVLMLAGAYIKRRRRIADEEAQQNHKLYLAQGGLLAGYSPQRRPSISSSHSSVRSSSSSGSSSSSSMAHVIVPGSALNIQQQSQQQQVPIPVTIPANAKPLRRSMPTSDPAAAASSNSLSNDNNVPRLRPGAAATVAELTNVGTTATTSGNGAGGIVVPSAAAAASSSPTSSPVTTTLNGTVAKVGSATASLNNISGGNGGPSLSNNSMGSPVQSMAHFSPPQQPLHVELRSNRLLRQKLQQLDRLMDGALQVAQDAFMTQQTDPQRFDTLAPLTEDECLALALYTFELGTRREDNFYWFLNNVYFRQRDAAVVAALAPFAYYFQRAWDKLPPQHGAVFRGIAVDANDQKTIKEQYSLGRVIQWFGVTSVSSNEAVAANFEQGGATAGVSFRIAAVDVRSISAFSAIPSEDELLMQPGTQLVVTPPLPGFAQKNPQGFSIFLQQLSPSQKPWGY